MSNEVKINNSLVETLGFSEFISVICTRFVFVNKYKYFLVNKNFAYMNSQLIKNILEILIGEFIC